MWKKAINLDGASDVIVQGLGSETFNFETRNPKLETETGLRAWPAPNKVFP